MSTSARGQPHPRNFGAHARLLQKYVREENLVSLATAIHKSTLAPAERLGLVDRGRIAEHAKADIVVFDFSEICERATWTEPCQLATGVRHVWINGHHILADAKLTGARAGRVLLRNR
ncbi:amidohydrolase family protein [Amycolatopsis thermoflava]|uniref:amidohydrolase family protein n=1 Tax=Amycolatopsis thermoflava TaxID=84480 RepID=UPI003EBF2780